MIVFLTFRRGGLKDKRIELAVTGAQPVLLGRAPQCHLVFPDDDHTVSACHAKLWLDDAGALFISDVSKYGLFVNGKAVPKARVEHGDTLQFGARGPEATVSVGPGGTVADEPRPAHALRSPSVDPGDVAMTMFRARPLDLAPGKAGITEYLKKLEGMPLLFQPGALQRNEESLLDIQRRIEERAGKPAAEGGSGDSQILECEPAGESSAGASSVFECELVSGQSGAPLRDSAFERANEDTVKETVQPIEDLVVPDDVPDAAVPAPDLRDQSAVSAEPTIKADDDYAPEPALGRRPPAIGQKPPAVEKKPPAPEKPPPAQEAPALRDPADAAFGDANTAEFTLQLPSLKELLERRKKGQGAG